MDRCLTRSSVTAQPVSLYLHRISRGSSTSGVRHIAEQPSSRRSVCSAHPQRRTRRHSCCFVRCQSSDEVRDDRQKDAQRLFGTVQQEQHRSDIGSDYGEGFMQFSISGGPTRLDVDTLNEQLKSNGAQRLRHAMCPDEAYACIFNWDDVIADTRGIQRRAWKRLASEEELPFPGRERQIPFDIRPERVITEVLQWTRDWKRAQELAFRVATIFAEEVRQLTEAMPGVHTWLEALKRAKIPCALVSQMPSVLLKEVLQQLDLQQFFTARVTAEDDAETIAEGLLSASFKLQRPPSNCVVFESSPPGIAAAHNCTMKAVALHGAHRGYQLQQADLTCGSLSELTVYNIRRLFALKGHEFMDDKTDFSGGNRSNLRIAAATEDPA